MNTSLQNNITVETAETKTRFVMQPNEEYIAEIKRIIDQDLSHYPQIIKAKKNSHLAKYIEDWCAWMAPCKFKFSTKCWYTINKLSAFVQCKNCGDPILRDVSSIRRSGLQFCSCECIYESDEVHQKISKGHLLLTEEQKQEKYKNAK